MHKELKITIIGVLLVLMTTLINVYHIAPDDQVEHLWLGNKTIDDFAWFFSMWFVVLCSVLAVRSFLTKGYAPRIIFTGIMWLCIVQLLSQFLPNEWPMVKWSEKTAFGIIVLVTILYVFTNDIGTKKNI